NSVVIGGNNTSFVSGTVTKFGNTAFTFPVGKLNNYQPLTISAPANEVEAFTAGYNNSVQGFGATLDTGLTDLSTCEHWTLQRNTGTSTVNVTLGWNASSCNVPSTISNARVASWDGAKWKNLGNSTTTGNVTAGTVTSSVQATTYTAFALAQRLQAPTDYNFYSGAVNLTMNSTSANAAYSTVGATSDNNPAPCWNTTGGSNVWFKFTANSTQQVSVQLFTGGASGTIQYPYIAIWQADGTTLVKCNTYASQYDNVEVGAVSLTSGATYYISVDNNNGSAAYRGTFKLSINDAVNYDYYQGATDVSPIINSCSAANAYTTTGATTDKTPGTCWNTTAGSNRWFKFVATSTQIKVEVKTAGGAGSLQYPYAALWSADGNTQLACQTYSSQYSNLSMSKIGLTVGNTYYISVDNHNGSAAYRGAFQLCLTDAVDYDYYEGAVDVSSIINNCSAVNAYTTVQATSDKNPGSCWNTTGGSNRWFKFVATSAQLKVEVKTTGVAGSIQYPYVALWAADGTTQVACQTYSSQYSNLGMNKTGLTIGNTYYISVDNHNGSAAYRGTFQLCLSDAVDYDYYEGAVDVSSIINNCSAVNAYTTVQATFDKNKGACWNTLGGSNRWFKFVATSTQIKLEVKTTGVAGSIQYPYVALWAADGTTQLACQTYSSQYSNLSLNKPGLTVGATYYISVDNNTSSAAFRGTFQLCLSDAVDYDYHEGAVDVSSLMNNCSAVNAYSTVQATADKNPGSCWNTIGGSNRWFKFVATSTQIKVEVKTTGLPGSLRYHYAALWGADGTTPVACQTYSSQFSNLSMNTTGLTVGNTYYISVDNHNGSASYRGSFQLCLSDAVDYDFYEGAVDVSSIMNNCSAVNAYTTVQATLDKNPGSCWNTTGGSNRWLWRVKLIQRSTATSV
ncbi:MAG: hypothetical protein HYU69_14670, partial [Bacteroidetes bacterium]|nr:hypothetical protein [Bacteroidota bacterium]